MNFGVRTSTMKTFAVVFAVLFAGIAALPQPSEIDALRSAIIQKDARIVAGIIENMINSIKERLVAAGYDPFIIFDRQGYAAITDDIAVASRISNFEMVRVANIQIHEITYGLLSGNLDLDLELPGISLSADDVSAFLHIYSLQPNTFSLARVSGRAGIRNLRLQASARVNIGLISGIEVSIRNIGFTLGGIDSALNVEVIGNNYSAGVNHIIGNIVPELLWNNSELINGTLERIIEYVISLIL